MDKAFRGSGEILRARMRAECAEPVTLRRIISIACCFSSNLCDLSTSDGGSAGGVHPDNAVIPGAQLNCRPDLHRGFRRDNHPHLLVEGLADQHDVRSEWLGDSYCERKAPGRDSRFQILWAHAQHDLVPGLCPR